MNVLYTWKFKNSKTLYNTFANTERELNDYLFKTYRCSIDDIEIVKCEMYEY